MKMRNWFRFDRFIQREPEDRVAGRRTRRPSRGEQRLDVETLERRDVPTILSFGVPFNLGPGVNTAGFNDSAPTVTTDGLSLLFVRYGAAANSPIEILEATRNSTDVPFANIVSAGAEGVYQSHPNVSRDGLTLLYSDDHGSGMYQATRSARNQPFSGVMSLGNLLPGQIQEQPSLSADGLTLFFTAYDNVQKDIYQATRPTLSDPWGNVINLGSAINMPGYLDAMPSISTDGLKLFFNSNRPGGFGAFDLYVATRPSLRDPWEPAVNLGSQVNTPYDDKGPEISPDGGLLYFHSNRPGGFGLEDLYSVTVGYDGPAAPTMSISDASATEGNSALKLIDRFVADGSGGLLTARLSTFGPDGNGDGVQDFYVTSGLTNQILRYDGRNGAFLDVFVGSGSGGLNNPHDVAFGPSDGMLYVSSLGSREILRYNGSTGAFVDRVASGLSQPIGLTFGSDGNLYIADTGTHKILRYDTISGLLSDFVGARSGGLDSPYEACFGPDGNLYVGSVGTQQVLRYDGQTGAFLNVFASTSVVSQGRGPAGIAFGPDGYLYTTARPTASCCNTSIIRFDAISGAFVDSYPLGRDGWSFILGPDGLVYDSNNGPPGGFVERFGVSSLAAFTVTLDSPSFVPVTANYSTANGTVLAGSDFTAVSGTVTFAPGQTKQTILVKTIDDSTVEPVETFVVNLSNPIGATIADGQGVGTIIDNDPKFYVVNDAAIDQIYRYGSTGASQATTTVGAGNTAPRGAASNVAGDRLWVADANKNVYVYDPAGTPLGSWTAGSLASNAQVEGITTNGTDIWIVDARQDKVFQYAGVANRLTGSQNAVSNFNLASGNNNPKGIVTDGTSIWVVNDGSTDKVFKYTMAGALLGSWSITGAGSSPTGITLDPTGPTTLWIVDSGTDRVYEFAGALSRVSGSQSPGSSFALAPGNTNPQDIADPPGASSSSTVTSTTLTSISLNPASPRTALTFTAIVTGGSDGDIVELHDNTSDGAVVVTGVLTGGSATLTVPANTLTVGTHELVAVYAGNGAKAPSVSSPILQVIDGRPTIVSIAPFSGPTTGGTIVVITGTNLDGATTVAFGPNSATSFTVNSSTQITATAPAGSGTVDIVVTTPDGSSANAGTADDFNYVWPAPKFGSTIINGGEMYVVNAYGVKVAGLADNNSIVAQLFVSFDRGVTLAPGAFSLDAGNVDVNTAGAITPVPQGTRVVGIIAEPDPNSLDANGGYKSYRLRFRGSSTYLNSFDNSATGNGGSGNKFTTLKDGFYTLNIVGANVHAGNSVSGTPMVGNASQSFWTMYASYAADDRGLSATPGDGNSAVGVNSSLIDFAKTNGDGYGGGNLADYNANFDWNLDGDIRDDVIEFAKRFGAEWEF